MARKKFTPKSQTEIKHEIYGLRGISKRGHDKARARARPRARIGNFGPGRMVLGGRFLRHFTMFLVILVLFSVVTNSSYSTYKKAVGEVYETTEGVAKVTNLALKAMDFLFGDVDFSEHNATISILSYGKYYNFDIKVYIADSSKALDYFEIINAHNGHSDWVGNSYFVWGYVPATKEGYCIKEGTVLPIRFFKNFTILNEQKGE